jgi:hypothetical protein
LYIISGTFAMKSGNVHLLASPYLFVSVHIFENCWMDFDKVWYLVKFSDTFLIWVKSEKNNRHFMCNPAHIKHNF